MADTTEILNHEIIDPVTGEIIDQKELAERLLAQAKEQGVSLTGSGDLLSQLEYLEAWRPPGIGFRGQ